jgi:CRP-like cAMP-binding protein
MKRARVELLQRMPVFGGIREDILEFLVERCVPVSVAGGRFFFREDDPADSMFVLEYGKVAVLKTRDGKQRLLRFLESGDCFGEMALMDLHPRSASVLAVEECAAIEISAGHLQQVGERDLEQFALIQMNMGREVSRRLREADERLCQADGDGAGVPWQFPDAGT